MGIWKGKIELEENSFQLKGNTSLFILKPTMRDHDPGTQTQTSLHTAFQ